MSRLGIAKDTGLTNMPLHDFDQNRIWLAVVALALEVTAWFQMLALTGHEARRWEPKRMRLRLFFIAGRIADHGRTRRLHLATAAPWAALLLTASSGSTPCRPDPGLTRPDNPSTTDRPVDPAPTPHDSGPDVAPLMQNQPSDDDYTVAVIVAEGLTKDPG